MEVIAERNLEIELPGELGAPDKRPMRVLVGKPEKNDDGGWYAPYEVHGPGAGEVLRQVAHGVDALQALALAIHLLPQVLERYERRGRLTDHGEVGFHLGLP